ncbi:uncharacterized protein LOC109825964 [Asparagus officinalis]|nr:uncharacterized protein LOC109825964 [Asparagus officinalis]
MGISKTEVNLRRLLTAAPQQKNQTKLVHYVTTLRELLEQLGAETTSEGISSISKAKLSEYSEKIEALAAKLASSLPEPVEAVDESSSQKSPSRTEQDSSHAHNSPSLRRRPVARTETKDAIHGPAERDLTMPVKLDVSAQAHIEKHRKLQEDLTDEMVVLARQLKESSLMMNQSLNDTEKILDSTEKAVEHSLASTGRANARAVEIYSESTKTTCFTWLIILAMTCIFVMVVLLIRVT